MNIRDLSAGSSLLGKTKLTKISYEKIRFSRQYLDTKRTKKIKTILFIEGPFPHSLNAQTKNRQLVHLAPFAAL